MKIVSTLVLLVLLAGRQIAAADTINIGYMPVINQSEIVAEATGLYKKYGLDVKLHRFQTGPAALQGLLSGDLQMVEAGGVPMLNLAAQNLPLYFLVSGGINTPGYPAGAMMIRPDDTSIKSFQDLKGKKVGQLGKGTITYLWLWNATAHFHMKRDDFQEIFVPFPQMGGLLASKQVDAVYAWPPFDTMIADAGQGRILVNDTAWNPYAVVNAMIVRKEWADRNPVEAQALVRVAIETGRWIDDHSDQARAMIGAGLGLPAKVYEKMRMFYFPRNGYQLMPSIWDFYYLMIKAGQLQPYSDPRAVIRKYWIEPAQRFITPALAKIGKQPDPVVASVLKVRLMNLPAAPENYYAPWER
ncbi:MAG TPA: ABC transporter substrate-binding protein [Stellaceae bacterium]|nr:ABC transporter substrate-binding protein [Stellaceae bacterium]